MIEGSNITLLSFEGKAPKCHSSVFIADGTRVVGDVTLEKDVSLWYNVVCRGDVNSIYVGEGTNIQDGSVVHINYDGPELYLGKNVTVGHSVTLHGCKVEDGALIGMGSCLLDGVLVGSGSLVAAGSLLSPGKVYPPSVLIQGRPGKVIRELTEEEKIYVANSSKHYIALKEKYKKILK